MIVIKVFEKLLVKEFTIELIYRYFSNILSLVAETLYFRIAFWCTFSATHISLIASRYLTWYIVSFFFLLGHEVTTRLKNYNTEATNFVLEPGSDSELSRFSEDSDTEDEIEQLAKTRINDG